MSGKIQSAPLALPDPGQAIPDEATIALRQWLTWGLLIVLLAAEVLGLTLRFDSVELLRQAGPTAWLLGHASLVLKWAIVTIAATILWQGTPILAELSAATPVFRRGIGWGALAFHFAALAVFSALSLHVFEGGTPTPVVGIAWGTAGLATGCGWACAGLPIAVWLRLLRRFRFALLATSSAGLLIVVLGQLAEQLWLPFGRLTLSAVETGLQLCGQDVTVRWDRMVIGTSWFRVEIAPSCSGYEGMSLGVVMIALFLWLDRRALRFPRALILLPIAAVLMWWANVARIVGLILLGSWWSREAALGGFHSQAGWIGLIIVTSALLVWARRFRWLLQPEAYARRVGEPVREVNLPAAYLGPLLALLVGALVTRAFSHDFDLFYPLRIIPAAVLLWCYRRSYAFQWEAPSWVAVGIGVVAYGLWLYLDLGSPTGPEPTGPWEALSPGLALVWVTIRVVGAVLIVPCAEELAFRSFLMRRLIATRFEQVAPGAFTWLSFVGSSLAFGLLHDRWLAGIAAGLLYALAYYARGKLSDAIVAHGVTNGLLAAQVLTLGQWSLW